MKVESEDFIIEHDICRATHLIAERLTGRVSHDLVPVMQYVAAGVPFFFRSNPMEIRTGFGYGMENDKLQRKVVIETGAENYPYKHYNGVATFFKLKDITYGQETQITVHDNPIKSSSSDERYYFYRFKMRMYIALALLDDTPGVWVQYPETEYVNEPEGIGVIVDELIFDKDRLSKVKFDGIDWLAEQVKKSFVKKYANTRIKEILEYCAEHELNELTMDILRILEESGAREACCEYKL